MRTNSVILKLFPFYAAMFAAVACFGLNASVCAQVPEAPTLPSVKIQQPKEGAQIDANQPLVVAWADTRVDIPSTTTYKITLVSHGKADLGNGAQKQGPMTLTFSANPDDADPRKSTFEIKQSVAFFQITLDSEMDYTIEIRALGPPNATSLEQPVLAVGVRHFHTMSTANSFSAPGFHLRRSATLDMTDADQPAKFAFTNKVGAQHTEDMEFALIYSPKTKDYKVGILPGIGHLTGSVETILTTDSSDKDNNAVRFRLTQTANANFPNTTHPNKSLFQQLSLKYEGDKNFKSQRLTAEYMAAPTFTGTSIGALHPAFQNDTYGSPLPLRLQPQIQTWLQPYLGFDFGSNIRVGDSNEKKSTIFRPTARLYGDLEINTLSAALNLKRVSLYGDETYRYLPLEHTHSHNYLESGLNFFFSDLFSVGLTYKVGEDSPNFVKTEVFGGNFGIKF